MAEREIGQTCPYCGTYIRLEEVITVERHRPGAELSFDPPRVEYRTISGEHQIDNVHVLGSVKPQVLITRCPKPA
jgi:hypothetical protein